MAKKSLTIEQRLDRLEKAVFGNANERYPIRAASGNNFEGPTGGIRLFISKGCFNSRKNLSDIRDALAKNGYDYVVQVVHNALSRLSRRGGPLVSIKDGGKKFYVKRK